MVIFEDLINCGLILALCSEKSREATASTFSIIAQTTTRTVSARLVSVAIKRVCSRRTLLHVTCRTAVASVTETSDVFHGIPRFRVSATSFGREVLFRPTSSAIIAIVWAQSTLTSDTIVTWKAVACATSSITGTFIGAFSPWVQVIGIHHFTNPGKIFRARSLGTIRSSPFGFTIKAGKAFAIIVHLTGTVVGAVILTQAALSMASFIPSNLPP